MWEQMLFYLVFLSQVLLISYYFPRKLLGQAKYVVDTYPRSEYPKLYGMPAQTVETAQRNYRNLNRFALLAGLLLLLADIYWPGAEIFRWNSGSVLAIYMVLQYVPIMIAVNAGFPYFSTKRRPDSRSTRTAELRPRRLLDFVSPALLGVAALVYVAFVVLVVYIRQFEFPWFGGYWNIVGVTALNLFFAGLTFRLLYGKTTDPYAAYEDRLRHIARNVGVMVFSSIAWTTFIGLSVGLRAFDLGSFIPIALSLYIQLAAVLSFRTFRIDETDFDVYKDEPLTTQAPS